MDRLMSKLTYIKILVMMITCFALKGQVPFSFPYQGLVVVDNEVISGEEISLLVAIQHEDGTEVFSEEHKTRTSQAGLFNISVGQGEILNGRLEWIEWGRNQFYLALSIRLSGDADYRAIGSTKILSVPYALHAKYSGNGSGPTGPNGPFGEPGDPGDPAPIAPDLCCGPSVPGPMGPEGPIGPQGPQGPQGYGGLDALMKSDKVPTAPQNGEIYLDDGTNRADGLLGYRYFDIDKWVDL